MTMKIVNMLEHQKLILENLSTNEEMFEKELQKSLHWLSSDEQQKLFIWLKNKYWKTHKHIIKAIFEKEAA